MRLLTLILLTCWSTASSATTTENPASLNLLQVTLSLLLVVGVLIGLSVLFKKFGLNRMAGGSFPVKVIGAVSIGNNQRLMMIEVGDEWILLGVTAQQITNLTSMPRQETAAANSANINPNFAGWMQSALEKYKNNDKKS